MTIPSGGTASFRLAITISFDQQLDAAVRTIWQRLDQIETPDPELAPRYRPHITLSAYDTADTQPYSMALRPLAMRFKRFAIKIDALGIFPEKRVLFLAPCMTHTLLNLHYATIETFGAQTIAPNLLPELWVPHCTLAMPSSLDQLTQAVSICQANWTPLKGECTGIGIVIIPEGEDRWYEAFPA